MVNELVAKGHVTVEVLCGAKVEGAVSVDGGEAANRGAVYEARGVGVVGVHVHRVHHERTRRQAVVVVLNAITVALVSRDRRVVNVVDGDEDGALIIGGAHVAIAHGVGKADVAIHVLLRRNVHGEEAAVALKGHDRVAHVGGCVDAHRLTVEAHHAQAVAVCVGVVCGDGEHNGGLLVGADDLRRYAIINRHRGVGHVVDLDKDGGRGR